MLLLLLLLLLLLQRLLLLLLLLQRLQRLLLQRLLLLLRRRRRLLLRLLLPPLLLVLPLPVGTKGTGPPIGTAALAATAAAASNQRPRPRCQRCNMLLEQVLLLSYQHGGLCFLLSEPAVRSLARIDGQTRNVPIELAARLSDVLAEVFEQHHAQILDHKVELVHVPNVFVIRTITGIESMGLKAQHMIQHLQNWGKVLAHLGQNLSFAICSFE